MSLYVENMKGDCMVPPRDTDEWGLPDGADDEAAALSNKAEIISGDDKGEVINGV